MRTSLGLPGSEIVALVRGMENELLEGGPADIRSWSTDWCTRFDAGHEWWGSFRSRLYAEMPAR